MGVRGREFADFHRCDLAVDTFPHRGDLREHSVDQVREVAENVGRVLAVHPDLT